MQNVIETVKQIVHQLMQDHGIQVKQILLFGSRARGNADKDSDWDFFVIVDRELSFPEKWDIIDEIKRQLAKLSIPNDLIVSSEKAFEEMKKYPGTISYEVATEGKGI
jgi:predicted nucleotidyltransferase